MHIMYKIYNGMVALLTNDSKFIFLRMDFSHFIEPIWNDFMGQHRFDVPIWYTVQSQGNWYFIFGYAYAISMHNFFTANMNKIT